MIVKFTVDMFCDPDFGEGEGPSLKGFASYDRSAKFRSVSIKREEAERLFNKIVSFLENTLEVTNGKSK